MAHLKSRIWKYFNVSSDNESTAECKLCDEHRAKLFVARHRNYSVQSHCGITMYSNVHNVKHKHLLVYEFQHKSKVNDIENCAFNIEDSDENLITQEQQTRYN